MGALMGGSNLDGLSSGVRAVRCMGKEGASGDRLHRPDRETQSHAG